MKTHLPQTFVQGDVWPIAATLHNADGTPFDLSGSPAVQWRLVDQAGNVVADLSLTDGISIADVATAAILIEVPKTMTAAIPLGNYLDQCRATDSSGFTSTQFGGRIEVAKSLFVP